MRGLARCLPRLARRGYIFVGARVRVPTSTHRGLYCHDRTLPVPGKQYTPRTTVTHERMRGDTPGLRVRTDSVWRTAWPHQSRLAVMASADRLGGVLTACSSSGVSNDWLRISTLSGGVGCQSSAALVRPVCLSTEAARACGRGDAPLRPLACQPASRRPRSRPRSRRRCRRSHLR